MPTSSQNHPARPGGVQDVQVLITAEEAYPAMERAFLAARSEIRASFRVFDLSTRLRSPEARAIGATWFDLILHVLGRGVDIHMILADFDPIVAPGLHSASWRSRRAFIAVQELAGPDAGRLSVVNATHSARVGIVPRVLLWPRTWRELRRLARRLNAMPSDERALMLEMSPGLRAWLVRAGGGEIRARKWPPPPLVPGTHHQKIAVFDRARLCIGGLDLDERRYDDKGHHRGRDETWHDVQIMCRGPVVDEAQRHLESFLDVVAGRGDPPPMTHLLRTLSRRRRIEAPFLGPRPVADSLAGAHIRMIDQARRLIYLETQFFRDRRIARALAAAARARPGLSLILVLPGAPEDVAFEGSTSSDARFGEYLQAECLKELRAAFGDRAAICSPVRPVHMAGEGRDTLCGSPIIYVHAKVSIFDQARAIVSSANLNARSLSWDTEAGVELQDAQHVATLQRRVFRHWLWDEAGPEFFQPDTAARAWRSVAAGNADCAPEDRKGFLVPYDPEPAERFGRRLPFVPEAMV